MIQNKIIKKGKKAIIRKIYKDKHNHYLEVGIKDNTNKNKFYPDEPEGLKLALEYFKKLENGNK